MRPGSPERIAYYRERAESGLPLFEEAPAGIPELQRNVSCLPKPKPKLEPKPKEPEKMNIDQAIEVLTADGAEEKLNQRISTLEAELDKLKKLRRLYSVDGQKNKRSPADPKLENQILDAIKSGPRTPKQIAELLGIHFMSVGKAVAASKKLTKAGNVIVAV
jgi:hypothetical protein